MHRNYATLFDSKYLPQGLALYDSLVRHSSESFKLFVLALDFSCLHVLTDAKNRGGLSRIQVIDDFHDTYYGMLEARANRTHQEYAWTCASNLCEYLMRDGLKEITYLDSDMLFFSDPQVIFDEIGKHDIAIIPHRFAEKDRARLEPNGLFNVSWVTFKHTNWGRRCLNTWARQCREWCYYRNDSGRFGDQKYLDDWPALYPEGVCVISNHGAGLAPWNIAQYSLSVDDGAILVTDHDGRVEPLVFHHFHETRFHENGDVYLTGWPLRENDIRLIYEPYIREVRLAKSRITADLIYSEDEPSSKKPVSISPNP